MAATQNQPNKGASGLESRLQAAGVSRDVARPPEGGTPNPTVARALLATTWIAALFCVLVCAAMIYQHRIAAHHDPWKSPQLLALKDKLTVSPMDKGLKQEIRRLDLEFRQRYFRRLTLDSTGAWLLIGGVATLLFASKQAAGLGKQLPMPRLKSDTTEQMRRMASRSRWSVAGLGGVVILALATLALTARSPLPDSSAELDKLLGRSPAGEAAADAPSLAEFFSNWPRFRGPDGGSVAPQTNALIAWDEGSGAGVLWKSPIPALGFNSPVVWSNRVFVAGGDAAKREVFCHDTASGQLLWQRAVENVPGNPAQQPELHEQPGFAAPTMATDGRRVYVLFANGDLAALTVEGATAWSKNLGVPKNPYGHATSLALWPGKLVVQMDQGEDEDRLSKLHAFDGATGRVLWERHRPMGSSWATPIIVEAAGKTQVITLGLPWVIAYSLADGNELWRAEVLEGEITPSPVFANGLVLVVNPSVQLLAIRPDGAGDVTKSHIAWTAGDNLPDVTSPVSNAELVFTVTSMGLLTCFDAKDGRKIWEKDLELEVQSSPAIAGSRLLVLSTKGDAVVIESGREFKELSRGRLEDAFHASPAFAHGRMYLRGATNLWCIGPLAAKLAQKP